MESVKDTEKFVNLVQMLLPEYEIRYHVGAAPSPGLQILFLLRKKYYPLPANMTAAGRMGNNMPVTIVWAYPTKNTTNLICARVTC